MKKISPGYPLARHEFLKWYHVASLGQALQALESAYLKANLKISYNRKTLQLGPLGSESRYVDTDFMGEFILGDSEGPRSYPTFVQADTEALPFATERIDTLILPHVLEFVPDPHQVLREVERVLKPEGRLYILGLNPWSPRRLLQLTRRSTFWNASLIAGHHLLDWLSLLKFDAELEAAFGRTSKKGYHHAENAWDELKAGLSVAYAIKAIKRNYTLIPIESEWSRITQLVAGQLLDSPQTTQCQKP